MPNVTVILWGFVIIGGPVLLLTALIWARFQSARRASQIDPNTPSDDPAKGM
ncbi:MAG: hypothetical protein JWM33_3942 [Caulobacteraceae bacterium]|nr:hypothetical protein [Caulobacteraceae bacterium]